MQQYRINFPLLIGLVVGTVLSSGAVYGLWKVQIHRKSDVLVSESQEAEKSGDVKGAVQYLVLYLSINPGDTVQRVRLANLYADMLEKTSVAYEERQRAISYIEGTLRDLPEERELRFRVATMYGNGGAFQDALQHLEFLTDDPKAQILKATNLFRAKNYDTARDYAYKLIGYDAKTDTFTGKGTAPDDASVYQMLAFALRNEQNPTLAERVIDQAVKANPESPAAYLSRGQYFMATGEADRGRADVDKAYKLGPEDGDVLYYMHLVAVDDNDFTKARELIEKGKKTHPQDPRFFQGGAILAMKDGKLPAAVAELQQGLDQIEGRKGFILMRLMVQLQLDNNKLADARDTIDKMKKAGFVQELCDWYEAQAVSKENAYKGNEILARVRPAAPQLGIEGDVEMQMAMNYEKLGRFDLAAKSYGRVLELNPKFERAVAGRYRAQLAMGKPTTSVESDPFEDLIRQTLNKPKAEQDWKAVENRLEELVKERQWDETQRKLVWSRVLIARKDFAAARDIVKDLAKSAKDDFRVQLLAIQVVQADPDQGPEAALKLAEGMEHKDDAMWRLIKADLWLAINDARTKPELDSLLNKIDDWPTNQKVALWSEMADRYLSIKMYDDARRCLTLAIQNQADDLQSRMRLFTLALESNDDEGVKFAQDEILKVVHNETDSNWLYSEARRRIMRIRRGKEPVAAVKEVRQLIDRALQDRPDWHELHVLNAELELMVGNNAVALRHLDRARELGRLSPLATAKFIQLLATSGEIPRAAEMLKDLPEARRQEMLGDLYLDLLFRTNRIDEAIKIARAQAEANPKVALQQFKYGRLLARSSEAPGITEAQRAERMKEAIKALELSVKIAPEFADGWYSLIVYSAMANDAERAQKALRDMQLAITDDTLQFVLAKSYEAIGRWFDAEAMYRAVYDGAPDNIDRTQQLAAFYLGPGYRQPDRQTKATPLINKILMAATDGTIPPNDVNLLWARRAGASILAASGDYQQRVQAENLLASNAQEGRVLADDRMDMAQILATRPEPESRLKAAALLEELDKTQSLGESAGLTLANLYFATGDWANCQRQMLKILRRHQDSAAIRARYVEMLLSRGGQRDFSEARQYVDWLKEHLPNSSATYNLVARYAIKTGKPELVLKDLVSRMPKPNVDPKSITDAEAQMYALFISLFTELKDYEHAEQLQRLLYARDPKQVFALASLIGNYRDVGKCFELLDAQYSVDSVQQMLAVGIGVLRKRRDEVGDRYDAQIETWLNRSLQTNPGSIPLLLSKAEFRELQKNYDEEISIYRELLASSDVTGIRRAIVLNNLSYLLAFTSTGAASEFDPLKLVNEAASILGPTADILDTRACVLIARKRYDEAIAELDLSVTDTPTAAKYFHKAAAHILNGQNRDALEAWNKAETLDLSRDSISRLEVDMFEKTQAKIQALRAGDKSVTRAEPPSR